MGLGPELRFLDRTKVLHEGKPYLFFGGTDYHRLSSHPDVLRAVRTFRHADPEDLQRLLKECLRPGERPLVLTDGVVPVDGELPPLAAYWELVRQFGGALLVDDARGRDRPPPRDDRPVLRLKKGRATMTERATSFANLAVEQMRIYRFDIPLRQIFTIATMSLSTAHNLLVELKTNAGIRGWGEASPFHSIAGETQGINIAAARELKQIVVGKNPLAIQALVQQMDAYLPYNSTLKSAVDMAPYDIGAQVAGLPLYAFLGGQKREIETDLTMGIGNPDEAGDKALAIRSMGFRIIKVKLGLSFDADRKRLASIRKAVGSEPILRIDANQGWDRVAAMKNLTAFEEFNIEFCEQPCQAHDLQGMRFVSRHAPIPVMADESLFSAQDALVIIQQDAAPYFNVKLSKSGGIHHAQEIAHVAGAGYRACMMGCMSESRLGITAAAHFALANEIVRFFDLDSFLEHAEDPILGGVEVRQGILTVPDAPGIGARPDPAWEGKLEEVR